MLSSNARTEGVAPAGGGRADGGHHGRADGHAPYHGRADGANHDGQKSKTMKNFNFKVKSINFGGCWAYNSGLRISVRAPEVPFSGT